MIVCTGQYFLRKIILKDGLIKMQIFIGGRDNGGKRLD